MNTLLIFGTLPPPIGGVTISLKNLFKSLSSKKNKEVFLFSKNTIFKFKRFDIGHIHYLKRWKIIVAILISNFICKKTILTYHGVDFYPEKNLLDRLILFLLDGIIVLNKELFNKCIEYQPKIIKLTPIFEEGITDDSEENLYFRKLEDKKYLLLYAFDKVYTDNIEVYGCNFILNLFNELPENFILVFIDPKSAYENDISEIPSNKIIYINKYVKFTNLLKNVDIYLRPTNFDGNSVATLESISLNTPVLASNSVERNEAIFLYQNNNKIDFIEKLISIIENKQENNISFKIDSINKYIEFCESL